MYLQKQHRNLFIIMISIFHIMQTSLQCSDIHDQDFGQECLYEGIYCVVKNTPDQSPEDAYLLRQYYMARAKSHPGFTSGLQTTGYLAIMQDPEKAQKIFSKKNQDTQQDAPYRHSNLHLREQWLKKGIECLISQIPHLTDEEIKAKRQFYTKQAMLDHEFSRKTREIGWHALKLEEDQKDRDLATQIALQKHAAISKLIMQSAQSEQQVLIMQSKQNVQTIQTKKAMQEKKIIDEALLTITIHDEQDIQIDKEDDALDVAIQPLQRAISSNNLAKERSFRLLRRKSTEQ